jgi:hypothetical protein
MYAWMDLALAEAKQKIKKDKRGIYFCVCNYMYIDMYMYIGERVDLALAEAKQKTIKKDKRGFKYTYMCILLFVYSCVYIVHMSKREIIIMCINRCIICFKTKEAVLE